MSRKCRTRFVHALLVVLFSLGVSSTVRAGSITTVLSPFTGSEIGVELVLSDDAGDGSIKGSLRVTHGIGDLRGLFLDITDANLLSGLQVSGPDVTGFETRDVIDLGNGNNLYGGGSPCPCDIGISFGTSGIGMDDIGYTEFRLFHDVAELTLDLFSEQYVGVRVTSVGDEKGGRKGSSKLIGVVPEPGMALLISLGLFGFGLVGRRR
jgi:hypothetical protein